jgi:hypothetical protein
VNRDTIREHLTSGGTLDGLALNAAGLVLARGKVRWDDTVWSALRDGVAVELQLQQGGERFRAPFVEPVKLRQGEEVRVQFGPKWQ